MKGVIAHLLAGEGDPIEEKKTNDTGEKRDHCWNVSQVDDI